MLLLIDIYDSFTYILVHYFGELGQLVKVYRNDEISVNDAIKLNPSGIIISPGPSDPSRAGICVDLLNNISGLIPVLGVCLGHQSIGQAFGGIITRADAPVHGKLSLIHHDESGIFKGLPSPFSATRYHSLIIERESLPDDLKITAQTSDGIIMGVSHKKYEIHGVQFHPESIASEHGHDLLKNFLNILKNYMRDNRCLKLRDCLI